MLIHHGAARGDLQNSRLAWSLAGIAGALNTAGFSAAGLYTSNMTGNASSAADHLALAETGVAFGYLALLGMFVSGAALSSLLINAGRRRGMAAIYALSILAEAALLTGLACADLLVTGTARETLLAYGLSFLMGLQNAVVTRISDARVRTTHITGMATDIGIELGNLADLAWHRAPASGDGSPSGYDAAKLRLHGFTVVAFVGGGVFGVMAYRNLGPLFLFAVAAILLCIALPNLRRRGPVDWPRDRTG